MLIKPSTELRNYAKISELAKKSREPIFITKNGEGDGVYMSLEVYEKMKLDMEINREIMEYEKEVSLGMEMLDAEEVLNKLEKKYEAL
ncbi:MAG: type II toxin-antitoxin system Phd/YefM family antitoxin [Lachnospiraceae bacterium]|nr:type II toxin-antitoxin system Phd/YefM family antitoxin [Lachnospiraceae bacterium]MCI6535277.1 type II toxin-antitoxin system Phd/YefM family antitoxin [Lachnospiraceae bacterium]